MSFDSPTGAASGALSGIPGVGQAGSILGSVSGILSKLTSGNGGIENDIKPYTLPQGQKPGAKNQRVTFLGSEMVPGAASGNSGGKTLLGL